MLGVWTFWCSKGYDGEKFSVVPIRWKFKESSTPWSCIPHRVRVFTHARTHARTHTQSEIWISCFLNLHFPWCDACFNWFHWKFSKRRFIYSLNLCLLFLPSLLCVQIEHKVAWYCHSKYFQMEVGREGSILFLIISGSSFIFMYAYYLWRWCMPDNLCLLFYIFCDVKVTPAEWSLLSCLCRRGAKSHVLWQVYSLFENKSSTECSVVFPFYISGILFFP